MKARCSFALKDVSAMCERMQVFEIDSEVGFLAAGVVLGLWMAGVFR
jgi:hypothetical protein